MPSDLVFYAVAMQLLVGIFWPSMMKLRSQYVPESIRATTLNLFRVPLNLFVCLVLYNVRVSTPEVFIRHSVILTFIKPLYNCLICQLETELQALLQ